MVTLLEAKVGIGLHTADIRLTVNELQNINMDIFFENNLTIQSTPVSYIEAGYNEIPAYIEMGLSPRVLNAFIFIRL